MGIVESVKNIFDGKEKEIEPKYYVTAIVVAAGNATRMRHSQGKLFINLCGMPILARTLLAFDESQMVNEVIVVARQDDILQISDMVNDYEIKKVNHIVKGGETRQQSVICGMKELCPQTDYIVIHDGARPLILPQTIDMTVEMAMEHQAAALGDIGDMFPDRDIRFKDSDSLLLLKEVVSKLTELGYHIVNIDSTIIAEAPKLKPFTGQMIQNIANICNITSNCVSVKATTEENMGFTGRKEGICAHSVCLIEENIII